MVNTVLVNYFREGLAKGNSIQILRKTLIDAGWPEVEVNAAKNEVRPTDIKRPLVQEINDNPLKNDLNIRKRPTGVALSAMWYWLSAAGLIVFPIIAFIFEAPLFLFLGQLILSLLPFFIGVSLWKGKKDGRITAIIFGFLAIIAGVYFVIESLYPGVSLILQLGMSLITFIIGIYLLSNRNAKEYFKKK